MDAREVRVNALRAARALIQHGWTQNAYARDAQGANCHPTSPRATCWCLVGAVCAVSNIGPIGKWDGGEIGDLSELDPLDDLANVLGETLNIYGWNDEPHRTQQQVLDLFDRAIAATEGGA